MTSVLGAIKANSKNIIDTVNAQKCKPSESINGYRDTIKNTIENTMPNDFGEECPAEWLVDLVIMIFFKSGLSNIEFYLW